MPLSVEQFIQELADSGLMSHAAINAVREMPCATTESVTDLAESLVNRIAGNVV